TAEDKDSDKKDSDKKILVTQYEGSVIEETGLVKMDFLGLKTLSIIKEALENIRHSRNIEINIDTIPMDDPATYRLYGEGRTVGTFQFESAGMQKYLRELQPSAFEDLIAMNALYRPGPMEYIPDFIDRKRGRKPIEYDIPVMENYLKDTYGITVYQEQVMFLSRLLANFTRGESDTLRKAMGKKLRDKLDHMKPKFIEGGNKNGYTLEVLEKIWADWEKFASYAFNKSHATCYSLIAYQTSYLKANYPAEYMAAAMSRNASNITEITKLMDECKAMGIMVLGPDVNESNLKFTVTAAGNIRFGLGAIKGVGEGAVQSIIDERAANGLFKGIFDFVQRVNLNTCNKKNMECLALAGGFDGFWELKREQYFVVNPKKEVFLETLIRYGNRYQTDKAMATNSLFGGENVIDVSTPDVPSAERWNDLERLNKEKELVGIYLSAHPLDEYSVLLNYVCNTRMVELSDVSALAGREITMGGIVIGIRMGTTKNGAPFGVARIEDYSGSAEIAFFGNDYLAFQGYLKEGLFLYINARCQPKQWRPNELEVKVTSIDLLSNVKEKLIEKITVLIPLTILNTELITELSTLIKKSPGKTELGFKVIDMEEQLQIDFVSRSVKVTVEKELMDYMERYEGVEFRIN
ncbi:DNA polymerase III subunit alpha, partial [termite gut metagenome]